MTPPTPSERELARELESLLAAGLPQVAPAARASVERALGDIRARLPPEGGLMPRPGQLQTMNAIRDARHASLAGGPPKAVLYAIATFAGADGWAFPSLETLGAAAGVTERTTSSTVAKLEQLAVIEVVRGRRQHTPNRYRIRTEALSALKIDAGGSGANRPAPQREEAGSTFSPEAPSPLRVEPASDHSRRQGGTKRHPGWNETSSRVEPSSEEGAQEGAQEGAHSHGAPKRVPGRTLQKPRAKSSPGARIAADWTPSDATVLRLRVEGLEPTAHVAEFVDFWLAVPGPKGRKADWDATFRNRMRQLVASGRVTPASAVRLRAVPPAPEDALDVGERQPVQLPMLAARVAT